jgi:hypothetical protein
MLLRLFLLFNSNRYPRYAHFTFPTQSLRVEAEAEAKGQGKLN